MYREGEVNWLILRMYVHSEIFLSVSLPLMVSAVCSFLAVEGNCQSHLYMSTATVCGGQYLLVRTPHSVLVFGFVPLYYELMLIPSEHKIH
jgi:hypothetical protein